MSSAFSQGTRTYDVRAEIDAPASNTAHSCRWWSIPAPGKAYVGAKAKRTLDPKGAHVYVVEETEADAFLPHRAAMRRVEVVESLNKLFVSGEISPVSSPLTEARSSWRTSFCLDRQF